MKLPWTKIEQKDAPPLIALSQLPIADWGRLDPTALVRDGYVGNAIAYDRTISPNQTSKNKKTDQRTDRSST